MTIATILASATADDTSAATLKTAIVIGRKFGAYVEAFHVRPELESVIPVVTGDVAAKAVRRWLDEAQAGTVERAERAHRRFQDVALEMSLPLTTVEAEPEAGRFSIAWGETTGVEAREIIRRGRQFDLTVLARPHDGDDQARSMVLTDALFEIGRPVLIAPPEAPLTVGQRLMLAWNDTREAAAGLWAAMPFAAKADAVTVVSVTEADSSFDPSDIVRYLAHHGIRAEGEALDRGKASVGERLVKAAEQRNCDLLVMGAYGHSRLQELILGGATKHVLKYARIPLLMVH